MKCLYYEGGGGHIKKILLIIAAVLLCFLYGCTSGASSLLSRPCGSAQDEILTKKLSNGLLNSEKPLIPENLSDPSDLIDLDGDGREELITFYKTVEDGISCVKVTVYSEKNGDYTELFNYVKPGSVIDRVFYPVFGNTRGLVFGWGLNDGGVCGVAVGGFYNGAADVLYSGSYSELAVTDLDSDGSEDILLISNGTLTEHGLVSMLSYKDGGIKVVSTACLSLGLTKLGNIMTANIGFSLPALICEGYIEGRGYISDYFVCQNGALSSIFYSNFTETSELTLREVCVWSKDVDEDGCVELPSPRAADTASDAYSLWFVDWRRADSAMDIICTTYVDFNSGWYLILPERMGENISVRISIDRKNVLGTLFYYISDEGERTYLLWEVFEFIGEDAWDRMTGCAMKAAATSYESAYSIAFYQVVYSFKYSLKSLTKDFHIWDDHIPVNCLT